MTLLESLVAMQDRYIGNIAAVILVCMLISTIAGKEKQQRTDYRMLMHLLGNIGIYSLTEMLSCVLDGIPGPVMTFLLYLLNSVLFLINLILAYSWARFIAHHLGYSIPKTTRSIMLGGIAFGILLLAANPFVPLVFTLENNVYSEHGPLYIYFITIAGAFFCYTLFIYRTCRKNGGALKYFPVWMYIAPSVIGILLEWYLGSSLIGICNAIAISAVLVSLQQEEVFRDQLTGLYNRAYLEELKAKLEKARNPYVSGIMLDMNEFKHINDNFGHTEGDKALITAAGLIHDGVGSYGDVIRYAGDEFVVILNTWDQEKLNACVDRINGNFENYNRKEDKPYTLSASMGYANFNAGTQTVNEFLNMIDKNMYESKRQYYSEHGGGQKSF